MLSAGHLLSGFIGSIAAGGIMMLTAAHAPAEGARTLDVGRINIREPDGTLRMVLSNSALEPGIIVKGREQPHPNRRSAGMLFYNAEGTENGGLVFDGRTGPNGERHSGGSLSFDRYEQDQIVQLSTNEDGARRTAGLTVNDQPERTFDFAAIERVRHLPDQASAYRAANVGGTPRLFAGRRPDGSAELVQKDALGIDRLVLKVTAAGKTLINFLDSKGHVTRTIES